MNEIPAKWNNSYGGQMPVEWNNSDQNKSPDTWSNNEAAPGGWENEYQLPGNWGETGSGTDKTVPAAWSGRGALPGEWGKKSVPPKGVKRPAAQPGSKAPAGIAEQPYSEAEGIAPDSTADRVSIADMARLGAGRLAGAARKVGGAAKNAAGNAAAYARSDEVKEKLSSAQDKAKSLAGGAGKALTGIKDKTGALISQRRLSKADSAMAEADNDVYDEAVPAPVADEAYGEAESAPVADEAYDEVVPAPVADEAYGEAESVPAADEAYGEAAPAPVADEAYGEAESAPVADEAYGEAISAPVADEAYGEAESAPAADEAYDKTVSVPVTDEAASRSEIINKVKNNIGEIGSVKSSYREYPGGSRPAASGTFHETHMMYNTAAYTQSPDPARNNENEYYQQEYVLAANGGKKSSLNFILFGIIGVLLLIIGVFCGIFFMLGRKDNAPDNIIIASDEGNTTLSPDETKAPADDKAETSPTAAVQATTAAKTTAKPENTRDDILTAYKKAIDSKISYLRNGNYNAVDISYTLYDMDHDGSPEMLLKYGDSEASCCISVYTFRNGQLKELTDSLPGSHTGFGYDYIADQIVLISGHMGYGDMAWYDIDDRGDVRFLISAGGFEITQNKDYAYYENKYNVADLDFSTIFDSGSGAYTYIVSYETGEYVSKDYSGISYKFLEDKLSGGKFTNPGRPPKKKNNYTTYDTSAAGSDFSFYSSARECRINTDSTELNLRAAPSTSAEIVELIPKGALVYEYGSSYAWSYVSYNKGGTTYYGYVSKQYLSYPGETVQVYSCNVSGTINASKGEVAGFASSYIVEGGTPELVRKSLGNGWRVVAFSYCYSKDIMWYELYDAEDGDYYGWVDASFISFN